MNRDQRTIIDVLEDIFRKYPNHKAFSCMGQTLTYGDLDRLSDQFASYLQNHTSLEPGDRIAIQLPNVLQYPVVVYGAIRAGMVVVNTNPLYTPREVKHQFNDSGAKALVVLSNIADVAAKVIEETQIEQVIVTNIADMHAPLKRTLLNFAVKHIKKMVPEFRFKNHIALREALSLGSSAHKRVVKDIHDVAVLQYTGGTTGVAKGAMLTHNNLVANMEQLLAHVGEDIQEGAECAIAPLPLYHIYAFTSNCMAMAMTGNHNVLIPNPRDIPAFINEVKKHKFTSLVGINTLFTALARHPEFRKIDLSSLRHTASGGMALTEDAANQWHELTGVMPAEGYGLTETSPVVSSNPSNAIQRGTVGTPVPGTEVKVIDENGVTLAGGEAGELCVKGPQVMKGYWQRPEATAEVLSEDGWLRTGDMAVIQDDGYIRIVDRKKDMIIVSGFNVFPNEIEDVICQHPQVVEAAAIGIEDEKSGEAVKLFVVREGDLSEKTIIDYCRENLTAYKVPKIIEFREELPKSAVGKILRKDLR